MQSCWIHSIVQQRDPQVFCLLYEEYLSTICFEPGSHSHPLGAFEKHGQHPISIHFLHATQFFFVFWHILPCRNTPFQANSTMPLYGSHSSPLVTLLPFSSFFVLMYSFWDGRTGTAQDIQGVGIQFIQWCNYIFHFALYFLPENL